MTGYLRTIKTTAVNAVQQSFTSRYPEPDSAGGTSEQPFVSIEYPVEEAQYPAVWVDFETSELRTVGIAYTQTDPQNNAYARWRFTGHAVFTIVAMTSNECDMIFDQMVSMTAFAAQSEFPSVFRQTVEAAPLVASVWSFDTVEARANAAAPGTPWGTMEVIYERGFALQVIGEFVTDPYSQALVELSAIDVVMTEAGFPDSTIIQIPSGQVTNTG